MKTTTMKGAAFFQQAISILDRLYRDKKLTTSRKKNLYLAYVVLIRKAAYCGNANAQFELGQYYEDVNFLGVNRHYNPKKCFYWYSKACAQNHPEACNNLAYHYDSGIGVKRNLKRAIFYYHKSSTLGSVLGSNNVMLFKKTNKVN